MNGNIIHTYKTRNGSIRYGFSFYAGQNHEKGYTQTIKKRGFKTYDDAMAAYYETKKAFDNGQLKPRVKRYKLKGIYDLWFSQYKQTVKESTYATTDRIANKHILPLLGDYYIDAITVLRCQKAVNQWFRDAPKTFNRYVVYSNNIFDYAVRLELIDSNPMKKVIKPRKGYEPKDFDNFYSKDELIKFLNCCKANGDDQIYMFFRLLAFSGMRKGETLALQWSDINFMNGTIRINKTVSKGMNNRLLIQSPKTRGSVRTISIDAETMACLKEWRAKQQKRLFMLGYNSMKPNQLVFTNNHNKVLQPTKPTTWLDDIQEKYHLRHITVHGFRHTHCSLLFAAGIPVSDVKERLGHSNIETTLNVYTHVTANQKKMTADKFAKFMDA